MTSCPKIAAQTIKDRDVAQRAQLDHCSVLTYCWAVENGHARWANGLPPTTDQLVKSLDRLKKNTGEFGQQYLDTIETLVGYRVVEDQQQNPPAISKEKPRGWLKRSKELIFNTVKGRGYRS